MIFVFGQDEKLLAVLSNDSPLACPHKDSKHTEKTNGENHFEFTIPGDHADAAYVKEQNLVAFKDLDGAFQLFTITIVEENHDTVYTKTACCEPACIELLDEVIKDVRPTNTAAWLAVDQALSGTRWQRGTVDDLGNNSTNFYYESVLSAINKIATVWRGEVRFRVTMAGSSITGRYVDIVRQRGSDTGKRFEYTKDLKTVKRKVDATNVKTAMYGRGKGEQTDDGFGRRLKFDSVIWTKAAGKAADKPLGQEWVGDTTALAQFGRPGGRHRFGVFEDGEETDPERLLQQTWDALQKCKTPMVQYDCSVLVLEQLSGYSFDKVRLGDTVAVIDREFNPALIVKARVIEVTRYLDEPERAKVILGNYMPSLVDDTAKIQDLGRKVDYKQGMWNDATNGEVRTSRLNGIIDALQNEIRAGTGSVTITDGQGILIVDDPANPTKAISLKGGIIGIANQKDGNGNFIWRTFGTGDGFTADLINAGTISFDRATGGTLKLGGEGNVNGVLVMYDETGMEVGKFDATHGFSNFSAGSITAPNIVNAITGTPGSTKTYYIDSAYTGNVPNDFTEADQNPTLKFNSILDFANKIPKILEIDINVIITGTFNENISFNGLQGHGTLILNMGTSTINGSLYFRNCTAKCVINGQGAYPNQAKINVAQTYPNGFGVSNCTLVQANYLKINASTLSDICMGANASRLVLSDCTLENAKIAALATYLCSQITMSDCRGTNSNTGAKAIILNEGSSIYINGTIPNSQAADDYARGFKVGTATKTDSPTPPGTVQPQTTKTFYCTSTASWRTYYNSWRTDNDRIYQGQWEYGNHRGCMFWNGTDAWSSLVGKNILSARLYIKRFNAGGYSSASPVHFYGHGYTSQPGGTPTIGTNYGVLASLIWNEERVINMPASFLNDVKNGTTKGLMVYDSDGSDYVILQGDSTYNIRIEFTYQ